MKVIESGVEVMRTGLETDFMTPEHFIEKVGRTCYKSEDKITDDSAAKFVGNLIKRGHEAMIEHWDLIFKTNVDWYDEILKDLCVLSTMINISTEGSLRSFIRSTKNGDRFVISGNMRAWRDFLKFYMVVYGRVPVYTYGMIRNYPVFFPEFQDYVPQIIVNDILIPVSVSELTEKERKVHQRVTVKFICDRGVSHEMVRHRVASFAQESTRYCNYSGDKYGKEITVVKPSWCEEGSDAYFAWHDSCEAAGLDYIAMIEHQNCSPQQARSVLPSSLKTEIIVTMALDDWDHFFDLRCDPAAHPDIRRVADIAKAEITGRVYS